MCTLRVLGRRDWSAQLSHYTSYSHAQVAAVAEKLMANGRASQATALALKYTSRRLGGNGTQVGPDGKALNDGCLHIIHAYYKGAAPQQQQQQLTSTSTGSSSTSNALSQYAQHAQRPVVHSTYV